MHSSRLRFTVRILMIVVAVVTAAVWADVMRRRSVAYRSLATAYAEEEASALCSARSADELVASWRRDAEDWRGRGEQEKVFPDIRQYWERAAGQLVERATIMARNAGYWRRRAAIHARLKEKYGRAASRPWEAVEPDPQEPE